MNSGETDRLWKLQTSANALILEGKRNATPLIQFFQEFIFGKDLGYEVWERVYDKLGLSAEYAEFVKDKNLGDNPILWLAPIIKGITCNKVVEAMKKLGVKFNLYANDLDKAILINDRDPNRDGSYIVGFKRNAEADEENKNLSANQLKEQNHKGITLLERLLLEFGYFLATGKHLDESNWTLCAGSRCSDGGVPHVYWDSGIREVDVSWFFPGFAVADVRSRSAVFCSIQSA
jgi:hypothetical protein